MANLKEMLKNSAIGAFVPLSLAHKVSIGEVERKRAEEIRLGKREGPEGTLRELINDACRYYTLMAFTGAIDVAIYLGGYAALLKTATGINITDVGERFAEKGAYALAAGIATAGIRAGINLIYNEIYDEHTRTLEENLAERRH